MSSDDEVNDVLDAARFGMGIWRAADDRGLIDTLKEFFKRPQPILVLGATGSGKTNLLASLASAAGLIDAISRDDRTEDTEKSRVKINETPFTMIDTPGQGVHKHIRDQAIREAMADRPLRVINVVSYGYHEYKAPAVGDAVDAAGQPREDYLEHHRFNELAALDEWLPLLGDRDMVRWLLTVVTKADLWWEREGEVLRTTNPGHTRTSSKRQTLVSIMSCDRTARSFTGSSVPLGCPVPLTTPVEWN